VAIHVDDKSNTPFPFHRFMRPSLLKIPAAALKSKIMSTRTRTTRSKVVPKVETVATTKKRKRGAEDESAIKSENGLDTKSRKSTKSKLPTPESSVSDNEDSKINVKQSTTDLKSRKLATFASSVGRSPFPDFERPTIAEAKRAHEILASLHGKRTRPKTVVANPDRAGCGDSPSVLDALVRTILSQNTSDINSTRAKKSMDKTYGGSDRWDDIVAGGQEKLEESIRSGGLSKTKSKVIISILNQTKEKYGEYSLDHLFDATNEQAMEEMISFQGVGPKTASCVLLFCLQRESFAVDTHVHRITGLLGWRPAKASRDQTHAHLDVRIPDEDKYGLHILLVSHGKKCPECSAGGKATGKCELRKAFRNGKFEDEVIVKKEKRVKVKDENVVED
jgi:endonuclease-3